MLVGKTITEETIKRLYPNAKPDEYVNLLSKEALDTGSQGEYQEEAIKTVNGLKERYGEGASTLICIYNATGRKWTYVSSHDWHGEIYSPYDTEIYNGQWSVFLHTKAGIITGSAGCVVYRIEKANTDLFIGWSNPYLVGTTNTFHVEMQQENYWTGEAPTFSLEKMYDPVKSDPNSVITLEQPINSPTFHIDGSIGQTSSPLLMVTVSTKM
jgi:hypothetical protein